MQLLKADRRRRPNGLVTNWQKAVDDLFDDQFTRRANAVVIDARVPSKNCENLRKFHRYRSTQENPSTLCRAGLVVAATKLTCRDFKHHCGGYERLAR